MKALKSFVPYLLIAALMAVVGAYNAAAEDLFYNSLELLRLGMFAAPLLVTLAGVVVGRGMRLPGFYPRWRAAADGALALILFLAGNSAVTVNLFGWSEALRQLALVAGQSGLENICTLFAGILLGRLTLLIGRRAKEAAPE